METKYLAKLTYAEAHNLYAQGIITQAQWEAYDFAWSNAKYRYSAQAYRWGNLAEDARAEFWKLYRALPDTIQTILRPATVQ